jgi:hypothetical protein
MQRSTSQCATELRHLGDGRVELPSEGLRIAAECASGWNWSRRHTIQNRLTAMDSGEVLTQQVLLALRGLREDTSSSDGELLALS